MQFGLGLGVDPILAAFLAAMILVILAIYFFFRRTVVAFREGYDDRRR
jgi:lipopolysaccharide export LptBFGC system permease protein LptF